MTVKAKKTFYRMTLDLIDACGVKDVHMRCSGANPVVVQGSSVEHALWASDLLTTVISRKVDYCKEVVAREFANRNYADFCSLQKQLRNYRNAEAHRRANEAIDNDVDDLFDAPPSTSHASRTATRSAGLHPTDRSTSTPCMPQQSAKRSCSEPDTDVCGGWISTRKRKPEVLRIADPDDTTLTFEENNSIIYVPSSPNPDS